MRVREEGMSLVWDLVSLMCLWAIRWREGQSLETDFCSVTPKNVGGVGGLQDRGTVLRRRCERNISGWRESWGPQSWACRGLQAMQAKLAECFRSS